MDGLKIDGAVHDEMVAHCLSEYPLEGCGLLAADSDGLVTVCYPTRNAAASAKLYTIDPKDFLAVDRAADEKGLEVVAVFHSHTHTPAYPSPTDVAQAPVPFWHYVLVSFEDDEPSVRSYRIIDGNISEEPVVLESR